MASLIDLKEKCTTNIINERGGLLNSERIYSPIYARSVLTNRMVKLAVLKSPSLYRRLINHYNSESGFRTIPKEIYHKLQPVSAVLNERFMTLMRGSDKFLLSSSQLVNLIASYSQSIPPYIRNYDIDYSNLNIERVKLLDDWKDIKDIDFSKYLTMCQNSLDLTRTEELQKSKFLYRIAFKSFQSEEQFEEH